MAYSININYRDLIADTQLANSKTITPTEDTEHGERITIGTVEVQIDHQPTLPGHWVLINRGATDKLSVGFATGVYVIELLPGESAHFRRDSAAAATLFVLSAGVADKSNLEYSLTAQ